MATYFMFGKYSVEAIKGMSADRTAKAGKLIQKYRGKLNSIHALTGDRDLVIIATFPSTEAAMKASIAITRLTGIAFATSEAIEVKDFDRLVSEI